MAIGAIVVVAVTAHLLLAVVGGSVAYRWLGGVGVAALATAGLGSHLFAYRRLVQRRKRSAPTE